MKRRRQKPTPAPSSAPKRQRYSQYYRNCVAASFCPADASGPRIPTVLRQFSDQCPIKSHRRWLNLLQLSCEKHPCLVRNCATGIHFAHTHGAKSLINSITMFLTYYVPKNLCVASDTEWRQLLAALYSFHTYCARNHYVKHDHVLTSALYTLRNFRIRTIPDRISHLAAMRYWHTLEPPPSQKNTSPSPQPASEQPPLPHPHRATPPPPSPRRATSAPQQPHLRPSPDPHPSRVQHPTSPTTAPPSAPHPQQPPLSPPAAATPSYLQIAHPVHPADRPVSEDNDVTYVTEATTNTDIALPQDHTHPTKLPHPAVRTALYNEATSAEPASVPDAASSPSFQVTHAFHYPRYTSDSHVPQNAVQHDEKLITADVHCEPYETHHHHHHHYHSELGHDPSSAAAAPEAQAREPPASADHNVSVSAQVAPTAQAGEVMQMQLACSTTNEAHHADANGEYAHELHSDPTRAPHVDQDWHPSCDGESQRGEDEHEHEHECEYEATLGGDTPLIVGQVMDDGWLMRSEDFEVDAQYTRAFLHLPADVAKMGMRGMSLSGLQLGLRNGIWRPLLHDNVYVAKAYPPDDIFYY